MARHRWPSGHSSDAVIDPGVAGVAQPGCRSRRSHRIPRPGLAARGRMLAAAVAAGAVAAAGQGLQQPERAEGSILLALGADTSDTTAYADLDGQSPTAKVLPQPEMMPVSLDTHTADVASLAKGQRIAEERAAADAVAERAAAAAAERAAAAEITARRQAAAGKVVMPTVGVLTSGFGGRWGSTHYGIDIANSIGTPIYATTAGVIVESGPASGFGLWVRLRHADGTISVYGHINESLVSAGQRVAAGEQIATMGNRGQSTGPHLHFEIWLNGAEKIDPLSWLRRNGVDI